MRTQDTEPISRTLGDRILVHGRDLATELIGELTFTEMFLLDLWGEVPPPGHVKVVDAVLVTAMEHGITPSTLASRLVLDGAPESVQGAMAAGLLAAGSRFLGVAEDAAAVVVRVVEASGAEGLATAARREVESASALGRALPGFGHNLHQQEDPRVERLIQVADEEGVAGPHVAALHELGRCLNEHRRTPLIVNAAGAIGALLSELGYRPGVIRGLGVVARSAGLLAHIVDEQNHPVARSIWQQAHKDMGGAPS